MAGMRRMQSTTSATSRRCRSKHSSLRWNGWLGGRRCPTIGRCRRAMSSPPTRRLIGCMRRPDSCRTRRLTRASRALSNGIEGSTARIAAPSTLASTMILVTGGAGFIGANFVLDWLAQESEPVVNLDALTYAGNLGNLASAAGDARHVFVRGSIGDRALVTSLLAEHGPRAIVNLAADTHVGRSVV